MSHTVISGRIAGVLYDEFVVDTGDKIVRVMTYRLPYDPLDDEGYKRIQMGDLVRVNGEIDFDFLEGREISANLLSNSMTCLSLANEG